VVDLEDNPQTSLTRGPWIHPRAFLFTKRAVTKRPYRAKAFPCVTVFVALFQLNCSKVFVSVRTGAFVTPNGCGYVSKAKVRRRRITVGHRAPLGMK
jgi:hypothetical protein